jgi:hypothetical protein
MQKVDAQRPAKVAAGGNGFRFWLCGAVVAIYFSSFVSLMSLSRSASTSIQVNGVTTLPIVLITCCMIGSVATTALFVFVRRAN